VDTFFKLTEVWKTFIPAANSELCCKLCGHIENITGANPMIVSYNASIVNFYNATGSIARLEKKISTLKNAVAYNNA
jgi:hypothetical protein